MALVRIADKEIAEVEARKGAERDLRPLGQGGKGISKSWIKRAVDGLQAHKGGQD